MSDKKKGRYDCQYWQGNTTKNFCGCKNKPPEDAVKCQIYNVIKVQTCLGCKKFKK